MLHAKDLHRDVWNFLRDNSFDEREHATLLNTRAWDLLHEGQVQEWLLGREVKMAITKVHQLMVSALSPKIDSPSNPHVEGVTEIDGNTWEPISGYSAAFETLQHLIVLELQIHELRDSLTISGAGPIP